MASIGVVLGPAPQKLGWTRLTMSPTVFLESPQSFLPHYLNCIAIRPSLPVLCVLLYDFPADDEVWAVDVPLNKIYFPDADG